MSFPDDLRFTSSHEWVRVEGDVAVIGITEFAQEQLGDVVHVELPEIGGSVNKGDAAGEIESVKAVSDVYAPMSGTVVGTNSSLEEAPELVNEQPYEDGWLFKVQISDEDEFDQLLDVDAYKATIADD